MIFDLSISMLLGRIENRRKYDAISASKYQEHRHSESAMFDLDIINNLKAKKEADMRTYVARFELEHNFKAEGKVGTLYVYLSRRGSRGLQSMLSSRSLKRKSTACYPPVP